MDYIGTCDVMNSYKNQPDPICESQEEEDFDDEESLKLYLSDSEDADDDPGSCLNDGPTQSEPFLPNVQNLSLNEVQTQFETFLPNDQNPSLNEVPPQSGPFLPNDQNPSVNEVQTQSAPFLPNDQNPSVNEADLEPDNLGLTEPVNEKSTSHPIGSYCKLISVLAPDKTSPCEVFKDFDCTPVENVMDEFLSNSDNDLAAIQDVTTVVAPKSKKSKKKKKRSEHKKKKLTKRKKQEEESSTEKSRKAEVFLHIKSSTRTVSIDRSRDGHSRKKIIRSKDKMVTHDKGESFFDVTRSRRPRYKSEPSPSSSLKLKITNLTYAKNNLTNAAASPDGSSRSSYDYNTEDWTFRNSSNESSEDENSSNVENSKGDNLSLKRVDLHKKLLTPITFAKDDANNDYSQEWLKLIGDQFDGRDPEKQTSNVSDEHQEVETDDLEPLLCNQTQNEPKCCNEKSKVKSSMEIQSEPNLLNGTTNQNREGNEETQKMDFDFSAEGDTLKISNNIPATNHLSESTQPLNIEKPEHHSINQDSSKINDQEISSGNEETENILKDLKKMTSCEKDDGLKRNSSNPRQNTNTAQSDSKMVVDIVQLENGKDETEIRNHRNYRKSQNGNKTSAKSFRQFGVNETDKKTSVSTKKSTRRKNDKIKTRQQKASEENQECSPKEFESNVHANEESDVNEVMHQNKDLIGDESRVDECDESRVDECDESRVDECGGETVEQEKSSSSKEQKKKKSNPTEENLVVEFLSKMYKRSLTTSSCEQCIPKSDFSMRRTAKRISRPPQKIICPNCTFSTCQPNNLLDHINMNHAKSKSLFGCSNCQFAASTRVEIMNHYGQMHRELCSSLHA